MLWRIDNRMKARRKIQALPSVNHAIPRESTRALDRVLQQAFIGITSDGSQRLVGG